MKSIFDQFKPQALSRVQKAVCLVMILSMTTSLHHMSYGQDSSIFIVQTNLHNWAWGHIGPEVRASARISKKHDVFVTAGYSYGFELNLMRSAPEKPLSTFSTAIDYGHDITLGFTRVLSDGFRFSVLASRGFFGYSHSQLICSQAISNSELEASFCECAEIAVNDFRQEAHRFILAPEFQYTFFERGKFSLTASAALNLVLGRRQFIGRRDHAGCLHASIPVNVPDFDALSNYFFAQNAMSNKVFNATNEWNLTGAIPRIGLWVNYKI